MDKLKRSHSSVNIFARGWRYRFDPPIETNCVAVDNLWHRTRKRFGFGTYIQLEQDADGELIYLFKGIPLGGVVEHYFFVWLYKNSSVRIIASHLRVVR